jgi:hypothetical protein
MKVELKQLDVWEQLGQQVKSSLQLKAEVRLFKGLSHALYELSTGLAFFLDYKKSLVWQKGCSYAFDFLLPQFYRMSFKATAFPKAQLSDMDAFVGNLTKDTLFVLSFADHPITAELYNLIELDQILNDKKIYHICVHHHPELTPTDLNPYSCKISSVSSDFACAELGSRFKTAPQIAHQLDLKHRVISKNSVQSFESQLTGDFKAFLSTENRIYDRAIFYNSRINAEALLQWLKQNKRWSGGQVSTTSPCYWGIIPDYKNWWDGPISEDVLRGMILIDAQVLHALSANELDAALKDLGSI